MDEFQGIYSEAERSAMIKKEYARLSKSIRGLDGRKKATLMKLFSDAAFMAVTLEETRLIIIRDGIIESYQNGANQFGIKKAAAVEVYDKMVNTYAKVIDQINKSLPDDRPVDASEDILKFAIGAKK